MVPTALREGRWPIRSMLWVSKDVEAEQISIEAPEIVSASGEAKKATSDAMPCASVGPGAPIAVVDGSGSATTGPGCTTFTVIDDAYNSSARHLVRAATATLRTDAGMESVR